MRNQTNDGYAPLHKGHATNARLNLEQYLELLLGPKDGDSAFDGDEARRVAWQAHRTELLPLVDPGSRPWAWWQYEAPAPPLPRESETDYLSRFGLLTDAERARLEGAGIQLRSQATRKP